MDSKYNSEHKVATLSLVVELWAGVLEYWKLVEVLDVVTFPKCGDEIHSLLFIVLSAWRVVVDETEFTLFHWWRGEDSCESTIVANWNDNTLLGRFIQTRVVSLEEGLVGRFIYFKCFVDVEATIVEQRSDVVAVSDLQWILEGVLADKIFRFWFEH